MKAKEIVYLITVTALFGLAFADDIGYLELDTPRDDIPREHSFLYRIKVRNKYNEAEKIKKAKMFYTEFDYNDIPRVTYKAEQQFKALEIKLDGFIAEFNAIKGFTAEEIIKAQQILVSITEMLFSPDALPENLIERLFESQDRILSYLEKANKNDIVSGQLKYFADKVKIDENKLKLEYEKADKNKFKTYEDYKKQVIFEKAIQMATSDIKNGFNIPSMDNIKKFSQELLAKRSGQDGDIINFVFSRIKDIYVYISDEVKNFDAELFRKWKNIYDNPPKKVAKSNYQIPKGSRFMFEIRTPHSEKEFENIKKELDVFKKEKYDGVVFVWDGKNDYENLIKAQLIAKEKGFRIWIAFSTCDYLEKSCFIDPELYEKGLSALSKNAEAFLMDWRRTSLHLQWKDEEWQNYTMQSCRKGNPEIGFIGEYYYGYNGTHDSSEWQGYVDLRDNYNGIIVVNFGFLSVNPKDALRMIRQQVSEDVPLVIVIWGESTHYLTSHKMTIKKRTKPQYRRINRLLERRFINAGFQASVGCAGDGSNKGNGIDDMCFSDNHINTTTKY